MPVNRWYNVFVIYTLFGGNSLKPNHKPVHHANFK